MDELNFRKMKKLLIITSLAVSSFSVMAQETIYPSAKQSRATAITGATVHVGNGNVINNGTVVFDNGKITYVGAATGAPSAAVTVNATGKHVYPGLILASSDLGLKEIGSGTRATNDFNELGENNASVRSVVAYNTDSKMINPLRSQGILLVNVVPQGGLITGSSSIVQLDAWNWEDAAYKMDNGIHFDMPNLINIPSPFAAFFGNQQQGDPVKAGLERIEGVKSFFREAKAYAEEKNHAARNLRLEAVQGLFNKTQKFYAHCNLVKEMLVAVDFAKEFGFDVVIVGGNDSYMIAPLLKANNISVILNPPHNLPTIADDDVDQPYKTPAALQKAGVLYCINDDDANTRYRNLSYNAGTAAAYGLTKEEALSAITLNAAKILGIADKTGSLEVGKDANIVVSAGDILDMKTSLVENAFIQGRDIRLDDKQKQLNERYKYKYGIK
jgi:imidazolonepropionase-like amidohydrolase